MIWAGWLGTKIYRSSKLEYNSSISHQFTYWIMIIESLLLYNVAYLGIDFDEVLLKFPFTHWGLVVIMTMMASQITSLTIVYSTVCSCEDQRKHQSSTSLAFVRGIHRWPVNSPHKGPVTRKMFPFDEVIMWYHMASWILVTTASGNAFLFDSNEPSCVLQWCPI